VTDQDLQDAIVRHAIELQRLTAGEQNRAEAILIDLERELRDFLLVSNVSDKSRREIEKLIDEAQKLIDPAYRAAGSVVDTQALALIVAEKTVDVMGDLSALLPTPQTLASLTKDVLIDGAPTSAWWGRQALDTAFKFANQVRQGVVNGETTERIVQRIVGKRGELGIMDVARRNARTLVASSINAAANDARLATYRKNSRFIRGVRWMATLDGHTCARCAALDGASWDLEGEPIDGNKIKWIGGPPLHHNDRCILSPIAKDTLGLGLDKSPDRASSLGPITGDTSFQGYFKRLTVEQQNEQFGVDRAGMMRAGKITIRDLISGTGRELTLDELRAL